MPKMASLFRPLLNVFSKRKVGAAKEVDPGVGDSTRSPVTGETAADFKSETSVTINIDQNQLKNPLFKETAYHSLKNDSLVEAIPSLVLSEIEAVADAKKEVADESHIFYKDFKRFDTVWGTEDHHFAKQGKKSVPTTKLWAKRVQREWKILERDLPDTIYVRAYEDRMDLLRAAIIGPAGTPYHDGLFFFDIQFPPTYPIVPPLVHYNSGGLRVNPNLYADGHVCLSLLGTWHGNGCEKWNPIRSTMLQVLVSIQALVLNANPFFNEPWYESMANTQKGKKKSLKYNEDIFVRSCRTMLYSLRRPPKHFEKFVAEHFRLKGRTILAACKAYMEGVQVGCDFKDEEEDVDAAGNSAATTMKKTSFMRSIESLFDDLLQEFSSKGADCDKFLRAKIKAGLAAARAARTQHKRRKLFSWW